MPDLKGAPPGIGTKVVCRDCGEANPPENLYCRQCGRWLSAWRPVESPSAGPASASYAADGKPAAPARVHWLALAGVLSSLVGLFFFGLGLGPLGVALGISALLQIRRSQGKLGGRGLAIAGIVLGVISFLGALLALLLLRQLGWMNIPPG